MVEVQNGDYTRRFERNAQPFDVTEKEARLLRGVEDLEPVPEVPATQNEDRSQDDVQAKQENTEQDAASVSEGERQSNGEASSSETSAPKQQRRTRSSQPAK